MRIIAAPDRVALDPSTRVSVDLVVHNDSAHDGVAFPTLFLKEEVAQATFEPAIGFLAAGTAQRFRVHLSTTPQLLAQTAAEWILFADGRPCARRALALVCYGAPLQHARSTPGTKAIDPKRKALILSLARPGATRPERAHRQGPARRVPRAVVRACLAAALIAAGLRLIVPVAHRPAPAALRAPVATVPIAPAAHTLRARTSVPGVARVAPSLPRPRVAPASRVLARLTPQAPQVPEPREPRPQPVRSRPPQARAAHAIGAARTVRPPAIIALDVPHTIRSGEPFTLRVASLRATSVRVVVKIGPATLVDQVLPAGAATVSIAPLRSERVRVLIIRAWARNGALSAAGSTLAVLVPQ